MLIDIGEKVHVIERRLFENDVRRHFVGVVDRVEAAAVRITGYVFIYDSFSTYVRSDTVRTRIIPLAVSGFVVNILPPDTRIDAVRYVYGDNGRLSVTDHGVCTLDVHEFGGSR